MTKKVVVASKNPVKIESTKRGFDRMFSGQSFSFDSVSVPSGVRDQPMTDTETLKGALNRSKNAQIARPRADYWVGIEGGIDEDEAFAWVVIRSKTRTGQARTATFKLPPRIMELIADGKELGEADDIVFRQSNSKQGSGAVGILTHNVIDRTSYYEAAVVLALIPFKNGNLYPEDLDG